jgi:WS/DGAT/MGAT family acyltransferase
MEPMRGLDAKFLYSETRTAHMHTLKVAVLDLSGVTDPVPYERLVTLLARRLDRLPPFRRRAVPIPFGLGHPLWVEDPDFDLDRHVSHRRLDPPGDDRALAAAVADIGSQPLPRDRPLWELVVVEGLAGNRLAVVAKVHHALADGAATVRLLQRAMEPFDPTADGQGAWRPEPIPDRRELLRWAWRGHRERLPRIPDLARRSLRGLYDVERVRRHQDSKAPAPFQGPRTPVNVSLTPRRTFAMTTLDFEDLRTVRRALGVTINDVFLAVCGGAVRSYLAGRGRVPRRPLVASVPLATDLDGDLPLGGNHVDNLYVTIGSDIADPLARVRRVAEMSDAAKAVRTVLGNDLFAQRAEVVPPQLYALGVRGWARTRLANHLRPPINLVASNVAGPTEPLAMAGAVLESIYSVGPILEGIGLNITAWSYAGNLHVSVLGSPESLPDPWQLADALGASLRELRDAVVCAAPARPRPVPIA